MTPSLEGLEGEGWVRPEDEADAQTFTQFYDEIAERYVDFKRLRGLFDIVALAKILKLVAPDEVLLSQVADLEYEPVDVPRDMPTVSAVREIKGKMRLLRGGCRMRQRADAHTLVEARTRTLDLISEAVSGTVRPGQVTAPVTEATLRLPEVSQMATRSVEQAYSAGLHLLAQRRFAEARDAFSAAIRADEFFAPAYARRALTRYLLGEGPLALRDAAAAICLDPRDVSFRVNYHQILFEAGVPDALRGISPAAREALARRYLQRGLHFADTERLDLALAAYDRALRIHPQDADILLFQGQVHYDRADYAAALSSYSQAIQIAPKTLHAYLFRGSTRVKLQDFSGALADFTAALDIDPDHPVANAQRAMIKGHLGDLRGAIEDATRALDMRPSLHEARFIRAAACIGLIEEHAADGAHLLRMARDDIQTVLRASDVAANVRTQCEALQARVSGYD
jgi:tetratricopeptide (TPR) repeat protein